MATPEHDPSIEHEPHLSGREAAAPTDKPAATPPAAARTDEAERLEHSVWDEPGRDDALSGARPAAALDYSAWLSRMVRETSTPKTWAVTALVAAIAGPAAIVGTLLNGSGTYLPFLAVVVLGPLMEEVMKSAAALWVVEKRPFLFSSRAQIATCALASGFVFAAVENLMYLHVYVPDASESLSQWRWTVCVALHMGCSLIASLGLMRIWSRARESRQRPELSDGAALLTTAVVIHGAYNGACVAMDLAGFEF